MEEIVIKDHYSNVVQVEVKFKVSRKLDWLEENMLKSKVLDMVLAVGPALVDSQMKKEKKIREGKEKIRDGKG